MLVVFAGIGAAFAWTFACFLWREQSKTIPAIQLNLIKNLIALLIFSPIVFTFHWPSYPREIIILFASGLLGIAIGDSLYINALKRLGTRRTLSIEALSPILATILGTFLINETLPTKAWVGSTIVTVSLVGIIRQKTNTIKTEPHSFNATSIGLIFGLLSVLFAVMAGILSRVVLTTSDLSPLQTTEIRLLGAIVFLLPIARHNLKRIFFKISTENKLKLVFATLLGTNLGILLQQIVFQALPIGLGWTILSISPIVSLIFSKAEEDNINFTSIILAITTFSGVAIALF
ncbi:DMT family transporter [Prochlorococcus sp. MIT 1300]|uniref:DMT family transporter n=1 Tax=Prochlorococcus sp. MIT 1300 TaxID=3096218 RepID=UPI002A75D05A|nr:DMT family transporter [Prochlorococcus sp. MIT 1300]